MAATFDFNDFWQDSDYARLEYVEAPPTPQLVQEVERTLGFRLPAAYLELARVQNGGIPKLANHRTEQPTSWAEDHVAITGIFSIGREKSHSLLGRFGSRFWIDHWGYPAIGVYFADCPSAGHDMVCLDYRSCGPAGEPEVVHVDQEFNYRITFLAKSLEAFLRGLRSDEQFEA